MFRSLWGGDRLSADNKLLVSSGAEETSGYLKGMERQPLVEVGCGAYGRVGVPGL